MGVFIRVTNQQAPCAICGQMTPDPQIHPSQAMAAHCMVCGTVSCISCARADQDNTSTVGIRCPLCRGEARPIRLDATLTKDSVRLMPPQSCEGWPELNEVVYQQMIAEVSSHLPVIMAVLQDLIPEKDKTTFVERLSFALSTSKYMEWCFNQQNEVRTYAFSRPQADFEAPNLIRMIELIRKVITATKKE